MAIFMLNGMITGQSAAVAGADCLAIDYVEIQERGGSSTRLSNVCAPPEVASILKIGATGRFFFRDMGPTNRLLGIERRMACRPSTCRTQPSPACRNMSSTGRTAARPAGLDGVLSPPARVHPG